MVAVGLSESTGCSSCPEQATAVTTKNKEKSRASLRELLIRFIEQHVSKQHITSCANSMINQFLQNSFVRGKYNLFPEGIKNHERG